MAWLETIRTLIPIELVLMYGVSLLISSLGFYRLLYFISIGYAFSVTAMAIMLTVIFRDTLSLLVALHGVALALYGLRLGGYLVLRERYDAYRRELVEMDKRASGVTGPKKLLIWLSVSVLYVLLVTPYLFNLQHSAESGTTPLPTLVYGLVIAVLGLGLEAFADRQKSLFKRGNPDRFCDVGLYRWVRCPNYLGEIVFWVGNWVAGVSSFIHWGDWVASLIGLICIILIMIGSTKRLEAKQEERYGSRSEYQKYVRTVPVLFPFIPLYSLKNVRVYLE